MKISVIEKSEVCQLLSLDGIKSEISTSLYAARKRVYVFFIPVLLLCVQSFAQDTRFESKIDPVFKSILTAKRNGKDTSINKNLSAHFKTAPTKRLITGDTQPVERYNCIVYTKNPQALRDSGIVVNSVLPTFVTAWATLDQITKMAAMPEVSYIKAPTVTRLHNDVAVGNTGASLLHAGKLNNTVYKGKNVLIAIFDTGIDWDHPDFRDPADQTKSRILRIWDQTITPVSGETTPAGFNYGVEYTQAQINDELDGTPANYVRERDIDGHGTHVAGTAAGNGSALPSKKYTGMAPEADLIIIKGGNGSFSSDNIIDAMTYLQALAASLGKPVVLNMSLGALLSAHDGSDEEEVAVNNFTASGAGRAVVISAGNDNGYNLHNQFALPGNSFVSKSFTVKSLSSSTENIISYQLYANGNNDMSATVTIPAGGTITVNAGHDTAVAVLNNNFIVSLYNYLDPNNNHRFIYFSVTRNGSNTASPVGTWLLSVTNNTAGLLTSNGWMSRPLNNLDTVLLDGGNNDYMVSTPGNASSAITVGSYVGNLSWYNIAGQAPYYGFDRQDSISSFSSRGPRIDGLLKPEITASGHAVISCLSSDITVPPSYYITNAGLYQISTGTSMSAPVVTGAVALLFQANPGALAADIKTLLSSTANRDVFTELQNATPNSTWGYGKVDIYKAAGASFGCSPVTRKMYQYDSALRPTQYGTIGVTTQRLAVRFTPDISGKLGGFYFFTLPLRTNLFMEVRTNNAGRPGDLLATMTIDSNSIAKSAMNYFDLTSYNVPVTSGTDYFIILARSAGNTATWGLFRETVAIDGRSLISADGGVTWTVGAYDLVIRSVVHGNGQLTSSLATATSSDTRDINTSNTFTSNCALISQLVPSGASPVTGTITSKIWLETGVPHYGSDAFVSRHYQITPAFNASGATGRITLYFTQQEFTIFNNDPASILDLPANPADAAGKANLRIGKYAGSSSDGSGLPGTYSSVPVIIDPADADIIWSTDYNRWEVSFDVSGFSGFVVQTKAVALPLVIEYFNGKKDRLGNQLNWKINCINASAVFEVQRSADGLAFDSIGHLVTTQASCSMPVSFTDISSLPGNNFYRIKIIESNGAVRYTGVVLLKGEALINSVYPTVLGQSKTIQVNYAGTKGLFSITDATGKQLYTHTLSGGAQNLALPLRAGGIYFYSIRNDEGKISGGKIIVN